MSNLFHLVHLNAEYAKIFGDFSRDPVKAVIVQGEVSRNTILAPMSSIVYYPIAMLMQ